MAKSEKPKKVQAKKFEDPEESSKKSSSLAKKKEEDDDDDDIDEVEDDTPKKGRKAAASSKASKNGDDDDDEDVAGADEPDEWEKPVEEEEWDPDFDEFDIPKSTGKKATGSKKAAGEEEDFAIDDEFKDLGFFDDSNSGFDDDDEDF